MKKRLSLLCALILLVTLTLPLFGTVAVSAETRARKTLYQEILERDGFIEGVWYPWFTHDHLGCGLTANEVAAQYITNGWYDFKKVGIDTYGADKIYAEIYNLKALGYNMLAYAGSAYGEGVVYDNNGDVVGIKEDYLQNTRRFLDICRDIGMPVMWNIYFHCSSVPDYYGMDAWNRMCRMLGDNTVADHYAQRFVKPLCKVLGEYDDVVALIALTDEVENEINDSSVPNAYANKAYGTTKEKILYFVNAMNEAVKATAPQIARTIAANSDDLGLYSEVEVDVLGRNRYSNNGDAAKLPDMYPTSPMLLTEYNLASSSGVSEEDYSRIHIQFRDSMKQLGYHGGFQWCWQPNAKGSTHDLLAKNAATTADFRQSVYDRYYYTIDALAKHRGEAVTPDAPSLFYYKGDGLVEWVPSRQATTVTIERSLDDGKTWKAVAADIPQSRCITGGKAAYRDSGNVAMAMYRVTVKDGKGHTASAVTNRPGAAVEYIGSSPVVSVTPFRRPAIVKASVDFSTTAALTLSSFGVNGNRPQTANSNVIQNGSFELDGGGQWNISSFLSDDVQVVDDATAPEGGKSLHFDTRGTDTPAWHTFKVTVRPYTDYTLSAWVKGAYISDNNRFYSALGVLNPATKTFATYSSYSGRRSREDSQIYPPAWDNEWHLRCVTFNSGDRTEVVVGLYGCSSEMWLDGLALYRQSEGVTYLGDTAAGIVGFSYNYEYMRCDPSKSLTENLRFEDTKSDYWQSGAGWDNGFLSIVDTPYGYGRSLKYTASANPTGISYIKWIPVKKNSDYVITFNYKVLKEGNGYIRLATRRGEGISHFVSVDLMGTSMYEGEDGWCTFSTMIDTDAFDKIALVITDLGGEALIDNFRVFLPQDGSDVSDRPGGGGTDGPVVRPTTTATRPVGSTSASSADGTAPLPTDGTTLPTDAVSAAPSQGETTVPAAPAEDPPAAVEPTEKPHSVVLWVSIGVAVLILAAGSVVALLLIRKKKERA